MQRERSHPDRERSILHWHYFRFCYCTPVFSVGTSSRQWKMAAVYASPTAFLTSFRVILVLPLLCLFLAQVDAGSMNRSEEVNALLKFLEGSDYDYSIGYWLSWNKSDETACAWIGVSCTSNYTVHELHFSGWELRVYDLTPLYALRDLRVLDLSYNAELHNSVLGEICGIFNGLTWLDLSGTSLPFHFLSGISACRNLRVLDLEQCFTRPASAYRPAPVLPSMSDLVNLQILNLAGNNFNGLFPKVELGDVSTLTSLDLSSNIFVGPIPALPNLTRLVELKLDNNFFTRFEEPWSLGSKVLNTLSVSNNLLAGMIPSSMANFPTLVFLDMSINLLSGNIPDLVNLQILNLAWNFFKSPFPKVELGELSTLTSLDLSSNKFEGPIPALPNLTRLVELKLDNNFFTGFEEPWSLGSKVLNTLSVSNNLLEGMIPSSMANFPTLVFLNMSSNSLSGNIPSGWGYSGLQVICVDLSQNQLSGEIPTAWSQMSYPILNLSNNLLTGNIPSDGSNAVTFYVLDLSHNNLSGPIPWSFFGNSSSSISALRLQHNHLSGDIVDALLGPAFHAPVDADTSELRAENNLFTGDLSRIANATTFGFIGGPIDLSDNHLQWSVSEAFPDPIKAVLQVLTSSCMLTEFRVGGNNFSGTSFPTACGVNNDNAFLTVLDLSNSHLQGKILAEAFGQTCVGSLQLVNLSNNHATGPLPTNLFAQFDELSVVDVSNNSLSGPLPVILPSSNLYNPKYFVGNDGLCGDPLPPCSKQGTGVQWWVLLIITSGSVAIAMGSCLAATWRWRVYKKQHQQDSDLIRTLLEKDSASLMRLRDLKKATENFAESTQIGEGGFGTVYMGKLNDGTVVAIKRSKREGSERDKEQFLNEVRILSQVNHRHLVKLLGCCLENKIAVLVFEFVSNGTLQEHLQGKIDTGNLSWGQRLKIAVQTAAALDYLHSAAALPIIHRDVKSANILLNENLDAKVADFGISRLAPLHATHVSTAAIQGTMGYIDPEYYTSFQLTDKSDVYSFGVVLVELISAKPGLDFRRGDETSLVNLARPYIERGDLEPFIDPVLTETYRDPTHLGRESISNVGRLAMKCLSMQSKIRPSMKQVLKELQNFSLQFSGTTENMDSIEEDGTEDLQCDDTILLSNSFSRNSSTLATKTDDGIEMSQSSFFGRFRSRSMA